MHRQLPKETPRQTTRNAWLLAWGQKPADAGKRDWGHPMVKQVTVFLPNRPGTLERMSQTLGEANIQVMGLMVADSSDFSCVRLICDHPVRAAELLGEKGLHAELTNVVATEVPDVPGGLATVLHRFVSADLNVAYAYCCSFGGRVVDIVCVQGESVNIKLAQAGFTGLTAQELGIAG